MTHIVISSFENLETGDMQAEGESITLFDSETSARSHFSRRSAQLEAAIGKARTEAPEANFITWLLILRMPLDVNDIDEALEDLELVLEETEEVDDPFGELVIAYEGFEHGVEGRGDYPQAAALKGLEAWLT
ncbi:MAG TPA: hypothetical protein VFN25_11475 [Dokdonella sp.]|uniref:hypothetical protein n=1 Tax=Dokdonella sp. TaxID=2291710 RepID=UPI002D7E4CD1|nr:hypothetical protein [Dokdonella sp.]HET9033514.1 hypothetical protein [Dokdonella sp.]